ncbi:MAG: AraC family transcriptional regulator [Myxococcota bacterium]
MGHDALAHQIIPLVEALASYGADVDRALSLAGISHDELSDPSNRLDDSAERRMWDAAVEVTGDRQIGLALAGQVRHGTLGAYEYLLRNSGTLAETIEWADRYMRLVDTKTRIAVRTEGELAVARVWRNRGAEFAAEGVECLFGVIAHLCRDHVPEGMTLRSVSFTHARIGDEATYTKIFRCPVHFDTIANELAVPAAALQCRLRGADPGLGQVLQQHVQGLLDSAPPVDDLVSRARKVVGERLATGSFSVEDVARTLHVSPRTLRRRLDAAGSSYTALLDDARRDQASHLVAHTEAPLAQVAESLGYGDPSAFYRAFKRWTDMTPAQYRKRSREGT